MSILASYVNKECSQVSPVLPTIEMKKKYGKDGEEIITYEVMDSAAEIASNGSYTNWTLKALNEAGISPASMNIHTGNATRLDGIGDIQAVTAEVDSYFANNNETKTEE